MTAPAGMWYCPYCSQSVDQYQLEGHLDSRKHTRWREADRYAQAVQESIWNGALPERMVERDDALSYSPDQAYATDGHLTSKPHEQGVARSQQQGRQPAV